MFHSARGLGPHHMRRELLCTSAAIPKAPAMPKRFTIRDAQKYKKKGKQIVMVTAYDYPTAIHADLAECDIILVGDSVGMVSLGYDTTQPVTMDEMLHHCRAVSRGAKRPHIVGDLPFGSYEVSAEDALRNAYRLIKDGNVHSVKLEGGMTRAKTVKRIVEGGIAVMGHTGLTPASCSALGGFPPQGRTAADAERILDDALALQEAGAYACILECIPERVAQVITEALDIPTIGIGAGAGCDGQVLVYHDLCGTLQHPHHAKVSPRFCKQYGNVGHYVQTALENYRDEVRSGAFPSPEYAPYKIPEKHWEGFMARMALRSDVKVSNITSTTPDKCEDAEAEEENIGKLYG